jgi:predicted ATPase/DNA-binding winged helix-turn-helix (wHTH) protein
MSSVPTETASAGVGDRFDFGPFSLDASERCLERDGAPVRIGDKAFEILCKLVEHAGQIVEKAHLLRQAKIASEDSLRFHIAALRKLLGEGRYVTNAAGQGYSFVAPVSRSGSRNAEIRPTSRQLLPPRPGALVGRDQVLTAVADQILDHRLVTLVGPGGVGKTSVALMVSHDLAFRFGGDVHFFDVGSISDPQLLASALETALSVSARSAIPTQGLVTLLEQRRMLLVLDGCEPTVDAAAAMTDLLLRKTSRIHILATSREALRANGERVYRLFPLDYPPVGEDLTAKQAMSFSAVELFVARATVNLPTFVLTDELAPLVGEVCRKLDGLALAIELAAGRISAYGVEGVARELDSQFALAWPGRRSAIARHQTLGATLEWSHRLLTEREQVVFRRLGGFAGAFTLEMATAAVSDEQISRAEAMEVLGSLVFKSLVQFDRQGSSGLYHLLDITRRYAVDRLREADEAVRSPAH